MFFYGEVAVIKLPVNKIKLAKGLQILFNLFKVIKGKSSDAKSLQPFPSVQIL